MQPFNVMQNGQVIQIFEKGEQLSFVEGHLSINNEYFHAGQPIGLNRYQVFVKEDGDKTDAITFKIVEI